MSIYQHLADIERLANLTLNECDKYATFALKITVEKDQPVSVTLQYSLKPEPLTRDDAFDDEPVDESIQQELNAVADNSEVPLKGPKERRQPGAVRRAPRLNESQPKRGPTVETY